MKKHWRIFLPALLLAIVVQTWIWQKAPLIDNSRWVPRIENLASDLTHRPLQFSLYDDTGDYRYSGHPGTTIIFPAALLHLAGVSALASLKGVIALINSLVIAAIYALCYIIRPKSLWWLVAGTLVLVHPLYSFATPTNAVFAPLTALLFVVSLLLYEQNYQARWSLYLLAGTVTGAALVTRMPDAFIISAPLILCLAFTIGKNRTFFILGTAMVTALVLNPLLWYAPFDQVGLILFRVGAHIVGELTSRLTLSLTLLLSPLASASVIVASICLFKSKLLPLSRKFLVFLLLITAVGGIIFLLSNSQSIRYIMPYIFTWDIFLPLFLLHLTGLSRSSYQSAIHLCIILFIISSQIFLLLYSLTFLTEMAVHI